MFSAKGSKEIQSVEEKDVVEEGEERKSLALGYIS